MSTNIYQQEFIIDFRMLKYGWKEGSFNEIEARGIKNGVFVQHLCKFYTEVEIVHINSNFSSQIGLLIFTPTHLNVVSNKVYQAVIIQFSIPEIYENHYQVLSRSSIDKTDNSELLIAALNLVFNTLTDTSRPMTV